MKTEIMQRLNLILGARKIQSCKSEWQYCNVGGSGSDAKWCRDCGD